MADTIEQNISHRTKVEGTYILTFTSNSSLSVKNLKNIGKITLHVQQNMN